MKILFNLFGKKPAKSSQATAVIQQVETKVEKTANKIQEIGSEYTEAVKAKYFTKTAIAKNGGEVEMRFDAQTGNLKTWRRQNSDGTVTVGKINSDLAPVLRISLIKDGNTATRKTIGKMGELTEVNTEKIDYSNYPEIITRNIDKTYLKGKLVPELTASETTTETIPLSFLNLSKNDYIDLIDLA